MTDLTIAVWVSLIAAVLMTALVVPLVVFSGMPVWSAVAVELAAQVGLWGAYGLSRVTDRRLR